MKVGVLIRVVLELQYVGRVKEIAYRLDFRVRGGGGLRTGYVWVNSSGTIA